MTPSEALGFLRGPTTQRFLFQTVVTIASRTVGAGTFTIDKVPRVPSDPHEMMKIAELANQPGGHQFDAVSVPMRNHDTLAAGIDGLNLPNVGPDIMVTGMLTACAFMYSADKNNMFCAHVEPTRAANPNRVDRGVELGVALTGAGVGFSNDAGAIRYFTKVNYQGLHHVNICGVRRGDGWSLYVQGISAQPANSIAFSKQLI